MPFKKLFYIFIFVIAFNPCAISQVNQEKMMKKIVTGIEVSGNNVLSQEKIIKQAGIKIKIGGRVFAHDLYADIASIYSLGYFKEVTAKLIPFKFGARVVFQVIENDVIDKIELKGISVLSKKKIKKKIKNKKGKVLNVVYLREDIKKIENLYYKKGYYLSRIEKAEFDQEKKILIIEMQEVKIKEISIEGNARTKTHVIEREIKTKPGNVYNGIELKKDRDRVLKIGYFSQVFPPKIVSRDVKGDVKIKFRVIERKVNSISGGLEQQKDGMGVFLNLNLINVIGSGELISLKGEYGNDKTYLVRYFNPWMFNLAPVSIDTSFYLKQESEYVNSFDKYIDVRRLGWDLGFIFPFSDSTALDFRYKSETVRQTDGSDLTPYAIKSVKAMFSVDKRNNKINPSKGYVIIFSSEKSISGIDYSRHIGQSNIYFKLSKNLVLAGRLSAGVFYSPTSGQVVLDAESFEVGGSTSLRGISADNPLEGTKKFLLNTELRYQFNNSLGGVLFYDMGNAYTGALKKEDVKGAAGVGLRVTTPVGPLRFDFAWGWQAFNFHFGIGQMF